MTHDKDPPHTIDVHRDAMGHRPERRLLPYLRACGTDPCDPSGEERVQWVPFDEIMP